MIWHQRIYGEENWCVVCDGMDVNVLYYPATISLHFFVLYLVLCVSKFAFDEYFLFVSYFLGHSGWNSSVVLPLVEYVCLLSVILGMDITSNTTMTVVN